MDRKINILIDHKVENDNIIINLRIQSGHRRIQICQMGVPLELVALSPLGQCHILFDYSRLDRSLLLLSISLSIALVICLTPQCCMRVCARLQIEWIIINQMLSTRWMVAPKSINRYDANEMSPPSHSPTNIEKKQENAI